MNPNSNYSHDGHRYDLAAVEESSASNRFTRTGTMMPMDHCPNAATAYAIGTSAALDSATTKAHGLTSVDGMNYTYVATANDVRNTCINATTTTSRNYNSSSRRTNTFGAVLPFPRIGDVEDAAQAVLSLRKSDGNDDDKKGTRNAPAYMSMYSMSPSPFSSTSDSSSTMFLSDNNSCPDQEDESMDADDMYGNEFDVDAENSEFDNVLTTDEDNDVATRLKRIAVCCRKYNIRPKNVARVQNEGDCMILLPKRASSERAQKANKKREQPERIAKQARNVNDQLTAARTRSSSTTSVVGAAATKDDAVADTVACTALTKRGGGRKTAISTKSATRGEKKARKTRATVAKKNTTRSRPLNSRDTKLRRNKNARALPVYSLPATEFGKGWVAEGYARQTGAYKGHIDKYWISPSNRKFRSIVGVRRFLAALKKYNGDEEKAYAMK